MGIVDDDRGQAVQVGAVLLFAVLIISFSTYQAFVVPSQNRDVEFTHNQQVQSQFQDLRSSILAAGQGDATPTSLTLGVRYPSRAIALNPGPASGALRTEGTTTAGVDAWVNNTRATGETGDFWDGGDRNFSTGSLVYQPNYNQYTRAPATVYENSLVYNRFPDENVTLTGQQLVRDNRLSVVTLDGSLSTSRSGSVSVDVDAVSASTRSVPVTNAPGERVTIAVPTKLPESRWGELLSRQIQDGHVADYGVDPRPGEFDLLTVEMEAGETYRLHMARVGVGGSHRSTDAEYMTTVAGNNSRVPENRTQQVVVEVRDQFNNPITGVGVDASTDRSQSSVTDGRTGEEGRAALTYSAPENVDGNSKADTVEASFTVASPDGIDGDAPGNVTVELTIENTDGSGTDGSAYGISFDETAMNGRPGLTCSDGECTYDYDDDSDSAFNLTAATSPTVVGANADFGLNTTDYGEISKEDLDTDGDGTANATFEGTGTGNLTAYVSSGGGGDTLDLWLRDAGDIPTVFSAVEPDPSTANDDDEFVRVFFGTATNTNGWTIADDDGQYSLPDQQLQGEYYFTKDRAAFTSDHGSIDESRVFEMDLLLANGGESLELRNSTDAVVDEVAYGSASTSNGWSLSLGEDEVGVRNTDGTGTYVDTDSADDWQVTDESTFFDDAGDGGGGDEPGETAIENASMTSLVPNANSQRQTVAFTLGTVLESTESVEIDLGEAAGADRVNYGSAGATLVSGPSAGNLGFDPQNSDAAVLNYSPDSNTSAGETVVIEIGSIAVGPASNQANPYSVPFTRSDGGSTTAEFSVARSTGDSELEGLSATALKDGSGRSQTISFTPATDLEGGERVAIDLTDAQQGGVDYGNAGVNTVSDGGAGININGDTAYISYTAPDSGVAGGTPVDIELESVRATVDRQSGATYEVGYSRARADTDSTTFDTSQRLRTVASTGETIDVSSSDVAFDIENTGSESVTVRNFSVDATDIDPDVVIDNGNDPEFETVGATSDGSADENGNNVFDADGTIYELSGGNRDTAEISPGDGAVEVSFRAFDPRVDDGGELEIAESEADADLTIRFGLSDGTDQVFHLRQP